MNLSKLYLNVPDYLEYAWLAAPNTTNQSLAYDGTQTTLTLTSEISDEGGHGSIASNQITLAEGTYYFEAGAPCSTANAATLVLMLVDVTTGASVLRSRVNFLNGGGSLAHTDASLSGEFTCAANTKLELRTIVAAVDAVSTGTITNRVYYGAVNFSVSSPNIQRATIKLWKLK